MAKDILYEYRTMRSQGARHHMIKFNDEENWKLHNWDGPAVEPIEGEECKLGKQYHLYGQQMDYETWSETRKEREGLPWYKNPSMRGTTRF